MKKNKREKYKKYFEIMNEAKMFAEKNSLIKLNDNVYFLDSILSNYFGFGYKNKSIIKMEVVKIIDAKKGIVSLKNDDFEICVDFINGIDEYLFKNYKDAQNMYDKIIRSVVESLKSKETDEICKFLENDLYKKDGFGFDIELKRRIIDNLFQNKRSNYIDKLTKDLLKVSKDIKTANTRGNYDAENKIIDSFASKIDYNNYMNDWLVLHPSKRDDDFDKWFNELIIQEFIS